MTKVDEDYPENKLTGAEFEIYLDVNANKRFDKKQDRLVGLMDEVETGSYRMEALRYGDYLLYEKKAPEGFMPDTGYYPFSILEHGKTVTVENKAGIGFINQMRKGSIRIEKVSEDGKLEGFTFLVESKDKKENPFSQEFVTDKDGIIMIECLRPGDYIVSEVEGEATERYILPEDVTVTVFKEKTTVARFENKLKPNVPKMGDDSSMFIWGGITLVSLLGLAGCAFAVIRRRKKEDKT